MKIFIIGMPKSGRTTVSKALCQTYNYYHIDAFSWVRSIFRERKPNENEQSYEDEFYDWFSNRLKINPNFITDNIREAIKAYSSNNDNLIYVIDGIQSPHDLTQLFDYNKDIIVFLNCINNQSDYKDYQNIAVSVMRDYCFWLSSANLLSKGKWIEYNFSIPGEDSEHIKILGQKNSIFIVKSLNKVISHLKEYLLKFNH